MSIFELLAVFFGSLGLGLLALLPILAAIAFWVGFREEMNWKPGNLIYAFMDKMSAVGQRCGRALRRRRNRGAA